MSKKVTWKKGMMLTAETFVAADNANEESLSLASLIASAGRFGLFTTSEEFELSLNINGNALEITSLSCHGITRSGKIIDIKFDSRYSRTCDTRITIPMTDDIDSYLLVIKMHDKKWRVVDNMYSEAEYSFELMGINSKIDDDSLPIGCIVKQYGWRHNETDFVPPCIYISAHPMHIRQLEKVKALIKSISEICWFNENCVATTFLSIFWPSVDRVLITLDKERDTLTPAQFLSCLQHIVNSFVIACRLDEHISLENQEPFIQYFLKSYDMINVYTDIEQGLGLCEEIVIKVKAISEMAEEFQTIEPEIPTQNIVVHQSERDRWKGIEI